MTQWHGGKGSAQRKVDKKKFEDNWDKIFSKKNDTDLKFTTAEDYMKSMPDDKDFRKTQQDLTELNGEGNRQRGPDGEDESDLKPDINSVSDDEGTLDGIEEKEEEGTTNS